MSGRRLDRYEIGAHNVGELSVVVPAYRVQGYLRQCLDSILDQSYADVEVVAVDDRSPDHCGEIMDEYAARDPRVRVVHLPENVGLGEARNIGLRHATGDYVWFVDSDDWLADGALEAIVDRLRTARPDVLFVDYARAYWNGKVQRNTKSYLFRDPPPAETFTLDERPSVLYNMMTIWNRIVRREFLLDLGLTFGRGYYEDVRVTYPILMVAERISMLDQVCYFYRQRRRGAITRTSGDKHFDAFAQYESIFAFMDARGAAVRRFRGDMFYRMMWHYVIILGRGDRVPPALREKFFHRMSEHYRRFVPPDYLPPAGTDGVKYRMIERDAYTAFTVLKTANQGRRTVRRVERAARRRGRAVARTARRRTMSTYIRSLLHQPIDDRLAVYAAYWFRGYTCNPRAIYEKARELAPDVHGVWLVSAKNAHAMPADVDYVVEGTRRYYEVLARAKYLVNNVNFPDFVVKRDDAVHVQTQHGTPLKTMGLDQQKFPVGANRMSFSRLLSRSDRWDFLLSSNQLSTEVWERAFPCRYELLETGYPRNDRLFSATAEEVAKLRAEIGVEPGQTAVLYAPTHRDYKKYFEPEVDIAALADALGPGYVLLVRAHYYYAHDHRLAELFTGGRVIDVSSYGRVEDLCLASDVLLTDYSSIMFDYADLDRPIVIYANDWETYKLTRGVYFDLTAEPPGTVATTPAELTEAFTEGRYRGPEAERARAEFRERFCVLDDGNAAERVVRRVFLGQQAHHMGVDIDGDSASQSEFTGD